MEKSTGIKIDSIPTVEELEGRDIFVVSKKGNDERYFSKQLSYDDLILNLGEELKRKSGSVVFMENYPQGQKTISPWVQDYELGCEFNLSSVQQLGYSFPGYSFQGWIDENENEYEDGESVVLGMNELRLSGVWEQV